MLMGCCLLWAVPAGAATDYGDDHFSPIRATEYITWRVRAQIRWYQRRIPQYAMRRTIVKMAALGVTVAAAVLAKYADAGSGSRHAETRHAHCVKLASHTGANAYSLGAVGGAARHPHQS